ncbi:MAG: type II toxin-antitoxin system HicA family toxin [Dehalococcoidia bacterium]|nr:MAG: type II toxin-antitoxin system HicA family toxin [Dehalococcoidia bacterium]
MTRLEKLVELFLRKPSEVSFQDVVKVLEAFGYKERPSKSGHRVFTKMGEYAITVPTVKGRRVKQAYVRKILERLGLEEWYEKQHNP